MSKLVPPTANLHLFPRCNYACRFCYATFPGLSAADRLGLPQLKVLFGELARAGVVKVTLAGGEPTLHPELQEVLRLLCDAGLVPSLVTNASKIDAAWIERHAPFLRWIAVSCDSIDDAVNDELGRRLRGSSNGQAARAREVFGLFRAWNELRPAHRRVRLKLNMVITARNADEDPRGFVRELGPERVKLFQCLPVAGENDGARDLACPDDAFRHYVERARTLGEEGIPVVAEGNEAMSASYLMIDPLGRVFQLRDGRYVTSRAISEVGLQAALEDVGGVDLDRFDARGGRYDAGAVPDGNRPYLIAVEGLDGCGKSSTVRALVERLGAALVENPPTGFLSRRSAADRSDEARRRAFYVEGNRAAAAEAASILATGRPVVMDRSAASTLAYGAAHAGTVAKLDDWPPGLDRPDLTVLLSVPESVRRERLARREARTREEERLAADDAFRGRVLDGYRALGVLEVRSDRALQVVIEEAAAAVRAGRTTWPREIAS